MKITTIVIYFKYLFSPYLPNILFLHYSPHFVPLFFLPFLFPFYIRPAIAFPGLQQIVLLLYFTVLYIFAIFCSSSHLFLFLLSLIISPSPPVFFFHINIHFFFFFFHPILSRRVCLSLPLSRLVNYLPCFICLRPCLSNGAPQQFSSPRSI